MKRIYVLALIMIFAFAAACGKKEVKKETEDSRTANEAFALVETVKEAYIKKDIAAIEKNSTKDGFRAVAGVMKGFEKAELSFNPMLITIEDGMVQLNVSWKGKWQKNGKTVEERGMAVFVMSGSPLKVDSVLRANPFRYPE